MTVDPLSIARAVLQQMRTASEQAGRDCDVSEECEESATVGAVQRVDADRCIRWRLSNAVRLTAADLTGGRDPHGYCSEHHRFLSYPEQQRGACSWCLPAVDPDAEQEEWQCL
jgi:hypothetical protein